MYWSITYLANDTGHPLGNKWQDSENYQILIDKLNPLLDKAIDQPDGIAPKYATNSLTQVSQCSLSSVDSSKQYFIPKPVSITLT